MSICDSLNDDHSLASSMCTLTPLLKEEISEIEHEHEHEHDNNDITFTQVIIDGYGEKTFLSGARYNGEFKDGKMNGHGKYIYKGGKASYDGKWKNDQRHGIGKATYEDGTVYMGEFQNDKRHGRGKKTWPDHRQYVGDWSEGKYHGEGEYTNSDGDKYVGSFKNDQKHGLGRVEYADGRIWYGTWLYGEKCNEYMSIGCRPASRISTDRSEPTRRRSIPSKEDSGQDSVSDDTSESDTISSSSSLHTNTSKAVEDGYAVKQYEADDIYEGQFKRGKRHGQGTMRYGDGDVYTGEWMNDKRHGFGKYVYATGITYEGMWEDGKWNGGGKHTDGNGTTYIGEFRKYKKHGIGEIMYADGRKWYGIWKDGEQDQELLPAKGRSPKFEFDAFFSHNWGDDESGRDNHERVAMVVHLLKQRGFNIWFDDEMMQGDVLDRMTEGIDESMVFVTFVTKKYISKAAGKGPNGADDNCKKEFGYAVKRKGVDNMIAVVMESSCNDQATWEGAVGAALGNHLYTSFTDDDKLDSSTKKLMKEINDRKRMLGAKA